MVEFDQSSTRPLERRQPAGSVALLVLGLDEPLSISDQSHLTREITRYAGESPSRVAEAARSTAFTALGVDP